MRTYSMKEVAKKIKVPPGTIRQWEKDLNGLLEVPRTGQGARIYTETEIGLLIQLKQMKAEKLDWAEITDRLKEITLEDSAASREPELIVEEKHETIPADLFAANPETIQTFPDWSGHEEMQEHKVKIDETPETFLAVVPDNPANKSADSVIKDADQFFIAMDKYKESFLSEVKSEIRSVLRKEVFEEVKKEINNGTFHTVKSLSDSIYKSTENTKSEIQGLAGQLEKANENTTDSLQYLSNRITNVSLETTEEIFSLSKQMAENTEELARYVDVTNQEINNLAETVAMDREVLEAEREQYRHEIRQRESAFQDMLASFRDVAASKEKKWWKFWSN